MTEIPDDIMKVAYEAALSVRQEIAISGLELIRHNPEVDAIIARAILAERQRCTEAAMFWAKRLHKAMEGKEE